MQTQQTPRPTHYFKRFYEESADFPEQLKFRRFGSQWFKKLYDDEEELRVIEGNLNTGIAELRRNIGCDPLTTLDYPRILVKGSGRDEKLYDEWMEYEKKLRTHSQDLCLVSSLFKLPVHNLYASTTLNRNLELFENGTFVPTNEANGAAAYQDPKSPDFVAVIGIESYDILTDLAINHIGWIEERVLKRWRRWFRMSAGSNHIELPTLVAIFDWIACIFLPILLTVMMFVLARLSRLMVRIVVVGVFGLIFCASAMLLSGRVSRSSIFALTVAYFAIASVFISTTGDNACKGG